MAMILRRALRALGFVGFALFVGQTTGAAVSAFPTTLRRPVPLQRPGLLKLTPYVTPIRHVVVVVMENRSVDNLFQKFPGADTVGTGLTAIPLMDQGNRPKHSYHAFQVEYAALGGHGSFLANSLHYVDPHHDYVDSVYYALAHRYVLADEMLQTNEGPSFPAHQYLIAGQSGGIQNLAQNLAPWAMAENPVDPTGCAPSDTTVEPYVNMSGSYPARESKVGTSCDDYLTIFDRLDGAFLKNPSGPPAWKYYTAGTATIWDAPIAVAHLYSQGFSQHVVNDVTGAAFFGDVQSGSLSPVSYIVPCGSWSDHPTRMPASNTQEVGPNWVNFIVNTIGNSAYWNDTTILVTWDDWGGWYDHVLPPHAPNAYGNPSDPYEYGFRVPLLIISSYLANPGVVDHTGKLPSAKLRTQAAILRYIETVFGLDSLRTADGAAYTGDLHEAFNYGRASSFVPVNIANPFPAGPSDCRQLGPAPGE